ncbi:MAG TPA: glycosyltransferase, partial [Ktedonobacteraceae bacterium]|nr:glycosyltransferase [Ktedonobacteraceae bacterium]
MMKDILSQQSSSPGMLNAAPSVVSEPTQILPTVVRRSPSRHLEGDQNTPLSLVCDLSVVIPTRNERDNIEPLLRVLKSALDGIRVEVLFVDDSDDDTPRVVREAARTFGSSSFHVHIEHRAKGPARAGGLATAVDLGMSLAQAKYVAVLDADLQHPPEQLRVFYEQAVLQDVDMVLASRYIKGGGYQGLDGFSRVFYSVGLKWTAKICFPEHLMRVSDPLGGFFLLRRSLLTNVTLRPIGYKILLEILIRCPWRSLVEVPYHFQARANGQSKASMKQGVQVLQHIWRLVKEVPDAARVWKISALLLINAIVVLMLLLLYPYITSYWSAGSPLAFVLLAGLDFWLVNRFIFPPRFRVADAVQSSTGHPEVAKSALPSSSVSAVELAQTVKTSASHIPDTPTTQMQTVKLGIDVPVEQVQTARLSADMPVEAVQTARMPSTPVPNTPIDVLHTVKRPTLPLHLTHARRVVRNTLPVTEVEQEHTVHMPNLPSRVLFKDKMLLRIAFVAAVGAVAWIIFTLPGALVILAAFFLGFSIITRKNVDQHQLITMLLGVTVGISCIDYVSWRFAVTNWGGWWIAVPLLFAETLGAVHTLGFQFTLWPWPKPYFRWREDPTHHPIFIFVPTVNEGTAILGPTLKGALAARDAYLETYPHGQVTIVVCNDGFVANAPDWRETEQLCQQLGVVCITRTKKGGAKAGNIEHARQMLRATDNALLVIFDADQVAKPDFLLKTIPAFGDPHIGWVQTGQYYRNLENPVARWADDQQAMFYNLICPGKAALN